jgi:hypothetical protein
MLLRQSLRQNLTTCSLDWQDAMAVKSVALLPKDQETYSSHSVVSCCSADHKCSHACTDAAQAAHLLLSSSRRCSNTIAILYGSISNGYLVEQSAVVLQQLLNIHGSVNGQPAAAEQQACWLASVDAWQLQQQDDRRDGSFSFTPALDAAAAAAAATGYGREHDRQPLHCQVSTRASPLLSLLLCPATVHLLCLQVTAVKMLAGQLSAS